MIKKEGAGVEKGSKKRRNEGCKEDENEERNRKSVCLTRDAEFRQCARSRAFKLFTPVHPDTSRTTKFSMHGA